MTPTRLFELKSAFTAVASSAFFGATSTPAKDSDNDIIGFWSPGGPTKTEEDLQDPSVFIPSKTEEAPQDSSVSIPYNSIKIRERFLYSVDAEGGFSQWLNQFEGTTLKNKIMYDCRWLKLANLSGEL